MTAFNVREAALLWGKPVLRKSTETLREKADTAITSQ